jgi:hypothetical protein
MEAKETIGTVICSGCNIPMIVTARHQILFSRGLIQVMYRCDHCGAETTATRGGPSGRGVCSNNLFARGVAHDGGERVRHR